MPTTVNTSVFATLRSGQYYLELCEAIPEQSGVCVGLEGQLQATLALLEPCCFEYLFDTRHLHTTAR